MLPARPKCVSRRPIRPLGALSALALLAALLLALAGCNSSSGSSGSTGGGSTSDDYGNTCATAQSATLPSSVSGNLETGGDVDMFKVSITTTGTLVLRTSGTADTAIALFDGNCASVPAALSTSVTNTLAKPASLNQPTSAQLTHTITQTGTYYIRVSGTSAVVTGSYTLSVSFSTSTTSSGDDYGNTCATAHSVTMNSSTNGNLETGGDVDAFAITMASAGTLSVTTTGTTDTYGTLLDANCNPLQTDDDSGTDYNFAISTTVAAGTYYVEVSGYDASITGAYTLVVSNSSITTDDYGNTCATAYDISANNSPTTGSLESAGDVDVFAVTLTEGGTLTVNAMGLINTVGVLYDANCNQVATASSSGGVSNFKINFNVSSGGTYYVSVAGASPSVTGNYAVQVWFLGASAVCNGATAVSESSSTGGSISAANQTNYYAITVTQGGTLTVNTTGSLDTYGTLYSPGCTELTYNDDDPTNVNGTNFLISWGLAPGTYYVAVRAYDNASTGAYTLVASMAGDTVNVCGVTAQTAAPGSSTAAKVDYPGDIDMFAVAIGSQSGTLTVATTGGTDTIGAVLDSNCNVVQTDDNSGTGSNFQMTVSVSANTTYYVRVAASDATTGDYTLVVSFASSTVAGTTSGYLSAIASTGATVTYNSGTPPSASSGPCVSVSGPTSVVAGGSASLSLSSSGSFTTVYVFVSGASGYYQVTLSGPSTLVDLALTLLQSLPQYQFTVEVIASDGVTNGCMVSQALSVSLVSTGDVQVSLSWDTPTDVDLHLEQPDTTDIYYGAPTSAAGGVLDVDSNAGCSLDNINNENITYPTSTPPSGTYTVRVDYWSACSETGTTHYTVTVRVKNHTTQTFTGTFAPGDADGGGSGSGTTITTFTYP